MASKDHTPSLFDHIGEQPSAEPTAAFSSELPSDKSEEQTFTLPPLADGESIFEQPARNFQKSAIDFEPQAPQVAADRVNRVGALLLACITLVMFCIIGRVVQLQTHPSPQIAERLDSHTTTIKIHGRPGNLLDRHGRLLASSRTATILFADPKLIKKPADFASQVEDKLQYPADQLEQQLREKAGSRYVPIDKRLNDERLDAIKTIKLKGLATQTRIVRDYPHNTVAGQLLGAVGYENKGLEGLELKLDARVHANDGKLIYQRDVKGRPLWVDSTGYQPPRDGQPVRLSIDLLIQTAAEEELAKTCTYFEAESGQAVVMDPRSGEILAMANWPTFNPNDLGTSKPELRRNRCVTDVYEPGSTFKPLVWAAATELGFARPDELIDTTTTGRYVSPKGRRLKDDHPNGRIDWATVLEQSSNIGMAIVGQRLGERHLHNVVRSYGFGSPTGSNLPGEVAGIVNPLKRWNHYSVTSIPMGQEIAVTPLQLVRAFCAIASDGLLPTPTIYAVDNNFQPEDWQIHQRVLSPQVALMTRKVLRKVVTDGANRKKIDSTHYPIFGKTGTAQVPDRVNGGYLPGQYTASFIGGSPVDKPCIVVAVIVHRPNKSKGYYGRTVSAPTVRSIIDRAMPHIPNNPLGVLTVDNSSQQSVMLTRNQ